MKLCDLHTHSTFSDGSYSPEELCQEAEAIGLKGIALCDHNTVAGLPAFLDAPTRGDMEKIPGAEFSVDYEGKELHLLGLYLPRSSFSQVSQSMENVLKRKDRSNEELIDTLNRAGYRVEIERIRSRSETGHFNRVQIGEELMAMGYVSSINEAFSGVLGEKTGYYRPPQRLSVWEMLDFIRSLGAVPVLAHPFLNLEEKELLDFLPIAKKRGLMAMECTYSTYDRETTIKSLEMADTFHLAYSGGSDFHGSRKPDIDLGMGKGNLQIPYAWAEALRKLALGT